MPFTTKASSFQSFSEAGIGVSANLNAQPLLSLMGTVGATARKPDPTRTRADPVHSGGRVVDVTFRTNRIWFDVALSGVEEVN
jgi:hypothetical protein